MGAATTLFRSLGFFVRKTVARPAHSDAGLVPTQVISLSDCVSPGVPGPWTLAWSSEDRLAREEEAAAVDLDIAQLDAAIAWTTAGFDTRVLWPNVMTSLPVAQEFVDRFLLGSVDARIVECLLASDDHLRFAERAAPTQPNEGTIGMLTMLRGDVAPSGGGRVLGSDIVGLEVGGGLHSYLCNDLEKDFEAKVGARPNQLGLYDDHAIARSCANSTDAEKLGEPVPWFAVRLVEHPRKA